MHRRFNRWLSLASFALLTPIMPSDVQADQANPPVNQAVWSQPGSATSSGRLASGSLSGQTAEGPSSGQPEQKGHHGHGGHGAAHAGGDHATVNHRFDDAARWSSIFDDPARDAWQKPDALVAALALKPGDTVADVGAGTGYFNRYLAGAVGASGAVFAVDVEPNLIEHMRARAEKEQTPNVTPVLASYDNPRLPRASTDVLMLVDTYHHIDARQKYFERVRGVLKPGGRLVVVDFKKGDIPVGPRDDHKLEPAQVTRELAAAGYQLLREEKILPYQYVLVFGAK